MSYDIFVQDLPRNARTVDDIPDSFVPKPLGSRAQIVDAISRLIPDVVFDDAGWAVVDASTYSIEISVGTTDPVESFAMHLRGDEAALTVVAEVLSTLGYRALAPNTASGFFDLESAREAYARWRQWSQQFRR